MSLATAMARSPLTRPRLSMSLTWYSNSFSPWSWFLTASATRLASTESGPRTGKSFSTTRSFGSPLISVCTIGERAFAVAAIVVEELDQGDVAGRVAGREVVRAVEQRVARLAERRGLGRLLGLLLAALELGHRLLENLRVLQEIIAHDVADRLALLRREGRLGGGGAGDAQARRRARGSGQRVQIGGSWARPSGGSVLTSSRCGLLRPAVEASIVKKPSRLAQILPGGRAFMMSSALTWPGEPGGSFAMARLAWVCAILKSPAFMNACAEASSAIAMLPLRP